MPDRTRSPDPTDPKGLIREAYRIDGITAPECRSIFMDWALSVGTSDMATLIKALLTRHGAQAPDHPMTKTLQEGLAPPPKSGRRGGRASRQKSA